MSAGSTHPLSQRVLQMEESATLKMAQLARNLRAQGHDVISLSIGEPEISLPTADELEPLVPKSPWHTNRIYRQ